MTLENTGQSQKLLYTTYLKIFSVLTNCSKYEKDPSDRRNLLHGLSSNFLQMHKQKVMSRLPWR